MAAPFERANYGPIGDSRCTKRNGPLAYSLGVPVGGRIHLMKTRAVFAVPACALLGVSFGHAETDSATPAPGLSPPPLVPSAGESTAPPITPAAAEAPGAQHVTSAAIVEMGFVDPIYHTVQFGKAGTRFDYVADGGQDVLFPTMRLSAELTIGGAHTLIFLYQPLDLRTRETLRDDLVVDDQLFPAGTAMDMRYGFDFYRASYLYDLFSRSEDDELGLGAGLQLRNAVIDFSSADGLLRRTNRDVGPVPLLKVRARKAVWGRTWVGFEADGMYAPVKYINGGRSDVVGAILDFSVRIGYRVAPPLDGFFNARYLGGGAKGTSQADADRGPGDGYTSNWLHFWAATIGARVQLNALSD